MAVIHETTGLDIGSHRPRNVADLDLTTFDRIIVLDPNVEISRRGAFLPPVPGSPRAE